METRAPLPYTVADLEHALDRTIDGEGDQKMPGTWRLWEFIQEEAAKSQNNIVVEEVTEQNG